MKYLLEELYFELCNYFRVFYAEYQRYSTLVCCTVPISSNDLLEIPSAALASLNDVTALPRSAALQAENSFCVIWLKMNGTVHQASHPDTDLHMRAVHYQMKKE